MTTQETNELKLERELAEFDSQFVSQVPAEFVQARENSINAVAQSELVKNALREGQVAPNFTLPNALGQDVTLSDLLAKGPVVLIFYRGEWCPYCNLTLRAYQAALPQFQELGAQLVAVSPQTPDNSLTSLEKKGLTYEVLSDAGNKVARQYGIVYRVDDTFNGLLNGFGINLADFNGDTSAELPASSTFVIEPSGVVRLASVTPDFTKRLDPTKALVALREIKDQAR